MRARRLEGPSLDAARDAAGQDRPRDAWEADAARRRFEEDERRAEVRDFFAWALPQVKPERRRVLELRLQGAPAAEVGAELGLSPDNVHQRFHRGMRDLSKLREQWNA